MTITAEAPRGGVTEYIGDASYTFVLRNREIERFEDKHRGIFDLWDGFFGRGKKPTSKEVRDIVALGLVGGGKKDHEADKIVSECNPDDLMRLYQVAQAVVGVAFMPDAMDDAKKKDRGGPKPDRLNVRGMIANGIVIGLRPEEIRDMLPKDTWLVFQGWTDAHSPKKPGSEAMSSEQYRELVRQVDGN